MAINFDSFIQTEEWQNLCQTMDKMQSEFVKDIIAAGAEGNVTKVQHLTGKIAMIEELKSLPDYLAAYERQQKKGQRNAPNE